MSKKLKPHQKPTFNQSLISKGEEPKVISNVSSQEPIVLDAVAPSNQLFRWVFLPDFLRMNKNYGFSDYKKNLESFFIEIEKAIYNKYANLTWGEIDKLPHCGVFNWKTLTDKQEELIKNCLPVNREDGAFYHIALGQKWRLFGYRENSMFHVILNDKEHKFDKEK